MMPLFVTLLHCVYFHYLLIVVEFKIRFVFFWGHYVLFSVCCDSCYMSCLSDLSSSFMKQLGSISSSFDYDQFLFSTSPATHRVSAQSSRLLSLLLCPATPTFTL